LKEKAAANGGYPRFIKPIMMSNELTQAALRMTEG